MSSIDNVKDAVRTDVDPIRTDARRSRARRRFDPNVACLLCGIQTPEALRLEGSTLHEAHHVAGRKNDASLIAPLCLNCHRIATEGQRSAGVDLARGARRSDLRALASWLAAIADFFALLAGSARRLADVVRAVIEFLDAHHPTWEDELSDHSTAMLGASA
jgi:hypothetical protein